MVLFSQGENCWRETYAEKASCLVDGEAYFSALRKAMLAAKETIYILGWDINSRFRLVRDKPQDNLPEQLREFLNALVERNPKLEIYIIAWDYSPLLALDREWLAEYKLKHSTHSRIHFIMQTTGVFGASHHQKVAVIDDSLAFSGGLDLTFGRWDTPAHAVNDKRRCDEGEGNIPRPYHDVQVMVNGDCAKALGDLVRSRWNEATGQQLARPSPWMLWLESVDADFINCEIGISLTQPESKLQPESRHVEQLFLDMIDAAEEYIYIENQYLTADKFGNALKSSLMKSSGPVIVVVTPYNTNGWLSQYTMDVLRSRMIDTLREADKHDRLRIFYPRIPHADEDHALNVHSKVMIVDDRMVRIGSSNLNNRSMGLDSECDLTPLTNPKENGERARAFLNRLLAEHLAVSSCELDAQWQKHAQLTKVIEELQGGERTLITLKPKVSEQVNRNVPDKALVDPEAPVDAGQLREILVPDEARKSAAGRLMLGGLVLLTLLALFVIWRWTPLSEWIEVGKLVSEIEWLNSTLYGPAVAVATVAIGGLIAIPITLLIVAIMLVFGSIEGAVYGFLGSVSCAVLGYVAGQSLGQEFTRKIAGRKLNQVSRQLSKQGVMTVVIVRLIPIAPFVIINMVAGASHINLRDFTVGSIIGLIPGTVALAILTDGVIRAASEPSAYHLILVALLLAALGILTVAMRHWLLKFKNRL
ncbi:MAG: VTT domain-containing protein [Gammaproteobacteria bacterium]